MAFTPKPSKFKNAVLKVVCLIPRGSVVSYGQIALYIGVPRAARQVGWILRGLEEGTEVPWWRVVNNGGRISIKDSRYSAAEQKALLTKEGIKVSDELTFDIETYRFKPDDYFIKKLELDPYYIEMIAKNISYSKTMNFGGRLRAIAKGEKTVRE